jgi:hypothetical protein
MATWTLFQVAEIVSADPDAGKAGQPMPPPTDESTRPRSLLDTWGSADAYADFFAVGEIARCQLDSIDQSGLFQFVQHCDNECLMVNPHSNLSRPSIVSYPWDDRHRQSSTAGLTPLSNREVDPEGMITTDLDEDDVILGNPRKLQAVLDYALARPNPDNKAVFFSNTCVPAVVGEDVESVVRRAEARSGRKVFFLTVTPRSMTTVFKDLLVDRRLAAERRIERPGPATINLIGFPQSPAVDELEHLLSAFGVQVNACFLPTLRPEVIDDLPRAALNVLFPNRTWQHLYDQLTFGSRTPHIAPNAPYGVDGTRRWLAAVVGALHLDVDVDAVWDGQVAFWRDPWRLRCEQAAQCRVGFVLRDEETYFLTTPSTTWGVPLVATLEEAGFGLDILMRVSDRAVAEESARALRTIFAVPHRHTIRAFDSFAFLRHRLKESPSSAFFTYQFFDWRLTEAGKASFSIQHFEMGVPGALRSVERIVDLCRLPFYRRYARYLTRSREGLRPTPGPAAPVATS